MIQAMKRMMALLLAIVMVLLASPFAVLAEGELIEETLTEVIPEETVPAAPVTNFSNAVSAVNLFTAGEKAAEPTYLEQIAALQAEAEALDPESETLQADCADIYARLMVAYEAAVAEREAGTITEEEYNEIYNATGAVIGILYGYGFDPYATMTNATSGTIKYNGNSIPVYFVYADGTGIDFTTVSYDMLSNPVEMKVVGEFFESSNSGYKYVNSHVNSASGTEFLYLRKRSSSGWRYLQQYSTSGGSDISTVYMVFEKNVTTVNPVTLSAGRTATQNVPSAPSTAIEVAAGVKVTFNGNVASVITTPDAAVGAYTASWTGTDGNAYQMTINVLAPEYYTVSFDVGEAAAAAGVTASSVKVAGGQTISDLPLLSWRGEDGQPEMVFAGWYSDEALTQEFTSGTVVNADTILYAKWVDPEADGVYYVNFRSQDGGTVFLTLSVAEGKTVSPAPGPTVVDMAFLGWSTELQAGRPASAMTAFNFSTPVSSIANEGMNGKTLNLYAWYAEAVKVSFVANGGVAVPTQTIVKGSTATNVPSTRVGYTFVGWSTNKDSYTAFDFATPVNNDLTLYAFWNANLVPVTIVYMYENADNAEYSPAGKSEKVYAPAGSYISVVKSTITNKGGTHDVRYSDTKDGALTGDVKQTQSESGGNVTIKDISDTYYQYETASNKRWVNPNGTTTVLVYYNRARVTLTFTYNGNNAAGSMDYTKLISEADRTKYAVSYTKNGNSFTYSFTAKYEEDITAVWPQVGWVKNSSGNTPSYTSSSWLGGTTTYTFYAWDKPNDQDQSSNMYTLESVLFNGNSGLKIVDGKLVGTSTLPSVFTSVTKDWLIYVRTTLPGEEVDFVYGGKNYTIYKEACQLGYTGNTSFGYKALNGCTAATSTGLFTTYSSTMQISDLTVSGGTLKEKFDATFPNQIASGNVCQVLPYDRSKLTLSVWTNADNLSSQDPHTAQYLYGDKIYNDKDTDLLKVLEASMEKANYRFAGWYTTSEFTDGTEYKPDENSTILANMNLYAKWEPNQFLAEYYLYRDDTAPYAKQGFAEGGQIDDKMVPVAVKDSFLGWYWYQNGQLVPFDFTAAVGANHVDKNGVLKLYARWQGDNGKVYYLPGIGGDNATQEVEDPLEYAINEASVQLKQPASVWTDGSVPNDTQLTFVGWKAPNGVIYQPGRYVLVTRNLMQFEAQWSKDAVQLIYHANGGEGSNVTENWARNSVVPIWDNMDATTPHFTREGYELIGWDENPSATTPTYLLGQGDITLTKDVTTLYAIWKKCTTDIGIGKTVTGNMGDRSKAFSFSAYAYDADGTVVKNVTSAQGGVSVNADTGEITFTLKHGETIYLSEVPVGGKVVVTEEATGYVTTVANATLAAASPAGSNAVATAEDIPETGLTITFTNHNSAEVDTGILLDSLPYVLILAVVGAALVLWFIRKRRVED